MPYNSPELPMDFEAMTHRIDEARGQSELNRRLRQAGIVQEAWLTRQGRRALHHVGHLLVTVGERLEQDVLPTASVQ